MKKRLSVDEIDADTDMVLDFLFVNLFSNIYIFESIL